MPDDINSDIYIGLMSGTSLDGVDVVIADFAQSLPHILYSATKPFEPPLLDQIRHTILAKSIELDAFCQLDIELGILYAGLVKEALEAISLSRTDVKAIGCHGQTIRHAPDGKYPYTLQIGDANTLNAKTGIPVVNDFRGLDIALGGQGAPLAPAFHNHLFRSESEDRVILNIGGIANITYLPANLESSVSGFDTGPGNTFLDYWIRRKLNLAYDDRGKWAGSGNCITELLEDMLKDPYFQRASPKSTGTEYFSPGWLEPFINSRFSEADMQATIAHLTVKSISQGINLLPTLPSACFVCGGGASNSFLLNLLSKYLPKCRITTTNELGMNPDFVEATAFAWLARQKIQGHYGNLPDVTKASSRAILGATYAWCGPHQPHHIDMV